MVRLSYTTLPNGNQVSNLIPNQNNLLFVVIDVKEKSFEIREIKDGNVGVLVTATKYHSTKKAKQKAKDTLNDMGIIFRDEVRKKV